ncbi:hypothetical protein APSETT444_009684 [Aspergillus pseudonomiae]
MARSVVRAVFTYDSKFAPYSRVLERRTSGGNVGFKDPDDSARLDTKTLKLYGNYVLIDSQNANFFTTRSESGVYSLQWSANETATPNRIPLKLRAIQPSTDSVLAGGFNPRGEL